MVMYVMLKHAFPFLLALCLLLLLDTTIALTPLDSMLAGQIVNPMELKYRELNTLDPRRLDVLFLGTSRTNNGFSPEAFEKNLPIPVSSYNMGLPAAKYGIMTGYLMDHIRRYGKPRLVLAEVTDFMLNPNFYTYNSTLYFQTLTDHAPQFIPALLRTPLLKSEDRKHILLSALSHVFRYRTVLSPLYWGELWAGTMTGSNSPVFKGWQPRDVDKRMFSTAGIENSAQNEKQFALTNFKAPDTREFKYFLNYCRQQSIPVVLVEWPDHPRYNVLFGQTGLQKVYSQAVAEVAHTYGISVIDLGQVPINEKEQLFANTRHLSRQGAERYSRLLGDKLFTLPQIQALFKSQPG